MQRESVSYVSLETWGMNFIICSTVHISNQNVRKLFLCSIEKKPNMLKFQELMNTEDIPLLIKVASFCKTIVVFFDRVHK